MADAWRTRGRSRIGLYNRRSFAGYLHEVGRATEHDELISAAFFGATSSSDISAAVVATLAPATVTATATLAIAGSTSATLSPATVTATATIAISATSSNTLAPSTVTATAAVEIAATSSNTLSPATVTATATSAIAATVSKTLDPSTVSATAVLPVDANASNTLAPATVSATAASGIVAGSSATLDPATVTATGAVEIVAQTNATLSPATVDATAVVGDAPIEAVVIATLQSATVVAEATVSQPEPSTTTMELAGGGVIDWGRVGSNRRIAFWDDAADPLEIRLSARAEGSASAHGFADPYLHVSQEAVEELRERTSAITEAYVASPLGGLAVGDQGSDGSARASVAVHASCDAYAAIAAIATPSGVNSARATGQVIASDTRTRASGVARAEAGSSSTTRAVATVSAVARVAAHGAGLTSATARPGATAGSGADGAILSAGTVRASLVVVPRPTPDYALGDDEIEAAAIAIASMLSRRRRAA